MREVHAEWTHQTVETNGVRLHCVVTGTGPLVLLLHGFPEFWYSWRHQIAPLAQRGFRVAVPDLRGYNDSDKPEGVDAYRLSTIVEDLAGLIRALGEARAHLVGHDWGGVLAYAFAMIHPEMTGQLVVLNAAHPAAFMEALSGGDLAQLQRSWYMFFFQLPDVPERLLAAHGYKLLKQLTFRQSRRGTFPPREIAQYVEAIAKPGALTGALSWYRAMFRGSPPARGWPRIAAPTLVIWGTADHFLGRSLTRGMRRHFSGPFTIRYLPGVSHWVQQEVPATVTRLLLKFLRAP